MARPVRGQVLSLREKEFVEAARAQGAGPLRIMFGEMLPNLASTILVFFTLLIANAILLEAALSFLGAGVRPPNPSWGTMIDEGVDRIATAPHLTIVPGLMLVLTVLALNVSGTACATRSTRARRSGWSTAMARFVVRRLIQMVLVMFAVSILTFLIFNVIPNGDPAVRMAGKSPTETQIEAIREEWGFDENIFVQYFTTMKKVFTGDLQSYFTQLPRGRGDQEGLAAHAVARDRGGAPVDVRGGLLRPLQRHEGGEVRRPLPHDPRADRDLHARVLDRRADELLPRASRPGMFPNGGYVEFTEDPVDWVYHLILPWTALAILFIGFYSRVLRSNVLDTINEDYVRTARAKGLSERQIMLRHVLRNSMIPIVTLWGLDFGAVLGGGAILTETVFDLQGVGQYAADSIGQLDVPPVLAVTMFAAFFIVLLNAIVDIVYAYLDPRIRLQ